MEYFTIKSTFNTFKADQYFCLRMSKRPLEPSSSEVPSQPAPSISQASAPSQSGAWARGGAQGREGGQGQGGGHQGQAQTQPWMQPQAGLRSSVLVQGGQQGNRSFENSVQGSPSTQGSVQLGGLRSSMPASQGAQAGGYQRSSGGIPGPPPSKRINPGMSYIRA